MPTSRQFTFSFGRNTPGVKGIGYQVDVVGGNVDFGIHSYPRSTVTVRNVSGNLGVDYQFSDVTTPQTLTGLKGGRQTGTYTNQDRVLAIENAELPPYGWQVYSANDGIAPADVASITVTDSLINEMGAFKHGRFEVAHVQFAFAAIAAVGPSSVVHVGDSVINSHTIMGNSDGVVKIEDSEIYGSRVQAIGRSRILLLNTALRTNERNPKCVPLMPSTLGNAPNRCNPVNPEHAVQFLTRGQGAVWVAGIDPIATAIRSGNNTCSWGMPLSRRRISSLIATICATAVRRLQLSPGLLLVPRGRSGRSRPTRYRRARPRRLHRRIGVGRDWPGANRRAAAFHDHKAVISNRRAGRPAGRRMENGTAPQTALA